MRSFVHRGTLIFFRPFSFDYLAMFVLPWLVIFENGLLDGVVVVNSGFKMYREFLGLFERKHLCCEN